jgi:hypothetical protein
MLGHAAAYDAQEGRSIAAGLSFVRSIAVGLFLSRSHTEKACAASERTQTALRAV